MILRIYRVEVMDLESLAFPETDIVTVVRCRVDGALIEPLAVRLDQHGELTVCANVCVPIADGITVDLGEHFGGARFLSLPRPARERVIQTVLSHVIGEPSP